MSFVLERISDPRVAQFWDEGHILATQMAKDAREPQPTQDCCVSKNHLWDLAAVYKPGQAWEIAMPIARVFNGPVLYVKDEIVGALNPKE